MEESQSGRVRIGHCPTKEMVADALTKLATAEVIQLLIRAMEGYLPTKAAAHRTSVTPGRANRSDMAGDGPGPRPVSLADAVLGERRSETRDILRAENERLAEEIRKMSGDVLAKRDKARQAATSSSSPPPVAAAASADSDIQSNDHTGSDAGPYEGFTVGDRVKVHGLRTHAQYNDAVGTVIPPDAVENQPGHILVMLETGQKALIKSGHIFKLDELDEDDHIKDQIGEAIDREEEQPPAAEAAAPEVASPVTEFRAPEVAEQAIDKEPVQDMMSDEDDEPVQGPGRPKKKRRGKARCRPGSSERRWAALEMAQRNIRTP